MEQTKTICPICNKTITGHPAISRTDSKTEICSECGTLQAMKKFINHTNILRALDDLERLFKKYKDEVLVITACFLAIRYDKKTCNTLENKNLNEIYNIVKKYRTIFDEQLNYEVDRVINDRK